MAPPLGPARIGYGLETLRQLTHLFGIGHDSGTSCELKKIPLGAVQLFARIAAQRPHKDALGAIGLLAVACTGAAIALGQSQLDPVGGTVDAAIETSWIDKRLQQKQGMTEPPPPIAHDAAFGQ